MIETVRVHYKDTTETEIAQIIAKWLVQAKARRERKYVHNFFIYK